MRRMIALVLTIVMLAVGSFAVCAYTPGVDDGEFSAGELFGLVSVDFEDATVAGAEYAEVELKTVNNVGFTKLVITLVLQEGLVLNSVTAAEGLTAVAEDNVITITAAEAVAEDGTVAVLKLSATAAGKFKVAMSLAAFDGETALETTASDAYVTVKASGSAVEGDVDGDGVRNTTDLAVLKKLVAGLITAEDSTAVYPDINDDGLINTTDLALLKKLIAGL